MKQRKTLSALLAAALMCGMLSVPVLAAEAEATDAAPEEAVETVVTYTVKKGDTIGKITANFYGTNAQRKALQSANAEAFKATKGKLVPGMVLVIPEKLGKDTRIPSPVAAEGETLYEIKYGDTLGKIAKANGYSDYKVIYERNKDRLASAGMIYEGQVIVLPVKPAPAPAEPAEPAEPTEPAEPAEPAEPTEPELAEGQSLYTVKKGDNLSKIAKANGIKSWKAIYELNKDTIKNANRIYPGQVIILPAKEAPATEPVGLGGPGDEDVG